MTPKEEKTWESLYTVFDSDNMLHGFGNVEKNPYGLKKKFCSFMDNMMIGAYLSAGRIIREYDGVLDEYNIAITRDMESQESYTALFEDKTKYDAIMNALAGVIYREMRQTV